MKIFSSDQIREIDKFTINSEPIASVDLMERAAQRLWKNISNKFKPLENKFLVIAGQGNNGGDGLAIARLMHLAGADMKVVFCNFSNNSSPDCLANLERLRKLCPDKIQEIAHAGEIDIEEDRIILDCIFGTGLTRLVTGQYAEIITKINDSKCFVISIDIPSGLFGEDNTRNNGAVTKANTTYTIQNPPLSSMFAENSEFYGDIKIIPIGLSEKAIEDTKTDYSVVEHQDISQLIKKRKRFDHKGIYGHALLIAGSYGKAGAAILAAKACVRSGAGLTTVHVPEKIVDVIQVSVPEAMLSIDKSEKHFSEIQTIDNYSAIGIGPGLATEQKSKQALLTLLKNNKKPIVIDADGLNILATEKSLTKFLKPGNIITPHPKEFERLFGEFENSMKKISFMKKFSSETGVIIILKGGFTAISLADGKIYFNTGGNPGMATGGSGDVLTGVITSLLAQGYNPEDAALLSVYIHSKAGDMAADKYGQVSLIASDIIEFLPDAFRQFEDVVN